MRNVSQNYLTRINSGRMPIIYIIITTGMGDRAYGLKQINMASAVAELITEAGDRITTEAGDTLLAELLDYSLGSMTISDKVLSLGSLSRNFALEKDEILNLFSSKEQQQIIVSLDNADLGFGNIMANEPFIGAKLWVYSGFEDISQADHLLLFSGKVQEVSIGEVSISLSVIEDTGLTGSRLAQTAYLARAGRYASPLNTNDLLPIVYGDLTDGSGGIWQLPCIDTANYVYCFAAHEVLSVANGNSIAIYADGAVVNPANYTFDESNDYESQGVIATITFTSDQANAVITARGKGKPTASAGATLMENAIDIVEDYLTVENSFSTSLFNAANKLAARAKFVSQAYKAAGVIHDDKAPWEVLTAVMGSFLGDVFIDGDYLLNLDFDIGTNATLTDIIQEHEITVNDLNVSERNLINRLPVNYAYNYARGEFASHTDNLANANQSAITTYGTRRPNTPFQAYWCRDTTSVNAVQAVVMTRHATPTWIIDITDTSLKRLYVDLGDVISVAVDQLYTATGTQYTKQLVRVIGQTIDLDREEIRFICMDLKTARQDYVLKALATEDGDTIITEDGDVIVAEILE